MDYKLTNINKKKEAPCKKSKSGSPKLGCINLSIPPFRKGSRKKKLGDKIPIQRWHELRAHPETLLREVAAFMRPTNRELVDTQDRLYVAETTLQAIVHAINIVFNKYLQDEDFPESETQREYLSFAIDAIQQINTAFKRIFKQEYEKSFNSPIKLVQDRVRHAGFRILELTQIEQRLLASSYQKLPDISWRDFNQVFYVHWFYNSYSQQRELSGCLKLKSLHEKTSFTGNQSKTPLQLYLTIQLFGLVDGNSLPNKIQHILDEYLSFVNYRVPVNEYDGENLVDGQLIISHNQSKSPQFKLKNVETPALQLDIFDLWRIIKKDAAAQERINGGTTDNISPALATLSETDRTPFVKTIVKQLRFYSRENNREHIAGSVPLQIYVGFSDCHKAMQRKTRAENKEFNQNMELMQILSENSANVPDDHKRSANEPWYLVDESEGGLRIRTQTSKFTTKTSIGQIIAFNTIQEKSSNLKLGFITRILRLNEKEIDISVVKMDGSAKSIILQDKQRPNKEAAMIGFFKYLNGSYSQLLLPNSWKVKPHQCLEAHLENNQIQRILIKSSSLQQREFTTYEIALL